MFVIWVTKCLGMYANYHRRDHYLFVTYILLQPYMRSTSSDDTLRRVPMLQTSLSVSCNLPYLSIKHPRQHHTYFEYTLVAG